MRSKHKHAAFALAVLAAILLSSAPCPAGGAKQLLVTDFGIKPGSHENAVPAVNAALEAAQENTVIVFPQGRYDFWPVKENERKYFMSNTTVIPERRCAILIENKKNITIEGSGSTFIFHDRISPVVVDKSTGVTVRNFSIDWDVPMTAQAEVRKVNATYIDVWIDPKEYPFAIETGRIVFKGEGWKSEWREVIEYGPDHIIPPGTGDRTLGNLWKLYKASMNEDGTVRIRHTFTNLPRKGDVLIMRHSARDHSTMFLFHSKDIKVQNVDIYQSAGLGILAQYSENLSVENTRIIPNAAKGRFFNSHDDGIHVSNCKGLVRVVDSVFEGLLDDPINIHGTTVKIIEKKSKDTLVARFMHYQSVGLDFAWPGDRISFLNNVTMLSEGEGKVKSIKALDDTDIEITFTGAVPAAVKPDFALENLTWAPDVEIKRNFFGNGRARSVLVSSPGHVIIEDNRFESSGSAILIAGDANFWFESGAVRDVLIRNNVFADVCLTNEFQFSQAIISIYPEIPGIATARAPFHRNIRIEDNVFHPFDYPVLYAKSVDGLAFKNNRIVRSYRYKPWHERKATLSFENCRNVRVSGTKFDGDVLGRNIRTEYMRPADITVAPEDKWNK